MQISQLRVFLVVAVLFSKLIGICSRAGCQFTAILVPKIYTLPLRSFFFITAFLLNHVFASSQKISSIHIEGTINPATANYVERSLEKAAKDQSVCCIIYLNTPGGLLQSTRSIVGTIMASPIPVIVYVSPSGAHAGSAGVFITLAANIAAMAPGTNIGAAHPVSTGQMDTIMNEKVTNDAKAFIRTIAEKRNRNIEWAEAAVQKSVAISASEALDLKIIDVIATDRKQLLEKVNGMTVETATGNQVLTTANAREEEIDMRLIEKILNMLSDPNISYILMMLGFYGLLFELYNPGAIFPGVVGGICLILAFYALQTLPLNYAGLALIIFGIILFLLEIKIVSHGILAIGGAISLLLGSMMLIREEASAGILQISRAVIYAVTLLSVLFFVWIIGMGIRAQKSRPVTGVEGFLHETGKTMDVLDPEGMVMIHGEIWRARSGSGRIEAGQLVKIVHMENFILQVMPV